MLSLPLSTEKYKLMQSTESLASLATAGDQVVLSVKT